MFSIMWRNGINAGNNAGRRYLEEIQIVAVPLDKWQATDREALF